MMQKLKKRLQESNKIKIFVGWDDPHLSMIAKVHEFGCQIGVTEKMRKFLAWKYEIHLAKDKQYIIIPPRPHRKQTIDKNMQRWLKTMSKLLESTNYDFERVAKQMALIIKKDYQQELMSGEFKELSEATLYIRETDGIQGDLQFYATGEFIRRMKDEVIY